MSPSCWRQGRFAPSNHFPKKAAEVIELADKADVLTKKRTAQLQQLRARRTKSK